MPTDSQRAWQPESGTYEDLIDIVKSRNMVYRYEDDPVPQEDVERILESARWSPSGHNTQPWEFIVLRDEPHREDVVNVLRQQREWIGNIDKAFPSHGRVYLQEAPVLLVVAGDVRYRSYFPNVGSFGVGETTVTEAIYYESIGCCMQNIHLAAKSLGYGTVHLTVRHKFHDELRGLLNLPDTHLIHDIVPIGVPKASVDHQETERRPLEEIIHTGQYEGDFQSDTEFLTELQDTKERVRRMHGDPSG